MEERERRKQIGKISVFITSIFVIFLSITYAFMNVTLQGTKRQVIIAGSLRLELEEEENNISITDAFPMYDEIGIIQNPFTFRLINHSSSSMDYILKLVDVTVGDKLNTSDVKYYLTKDGVGSPALLSTIIDGQVDSGKIAGNQTIEYTLRLWIDSNVTDNSAISGKSLSYKLELVAEMIHNYTVTFHANGGTGEDEVIVCYEQEDCILTTTGISKENNIIAGWETTDGTFYANHAVVKTMP